MTKEKQEKNGFKYLEIENQYASAKIALQGGHVFAYQRKGKEPLLWLSPKAFMEEGKAIRGGIPICFPWFGKNDNNSSLPQHGFARTSLWQLTQKKEHDDGSTEIHLELRENQESLKLWAYRFEVTLVVTIAQKLSLKMYVRNCDSKAFTVSMALHIYLNISNIEKVRVEGLEKMKYFDSLTQKHEVEKGTLTINEEIDRVYESQKERVFLHDSARTIEINSIGSKSLVVWNPWREKSLSMADMSDDGYQTMLCLETANALADSRVLEAGESHCLGVVYGE